MDKNRHPYSFWMQVSYIYNGDMILNPNFKSFETNLYPKLISYGLDIEIKNHSRLLMVYFTISFIDIYLW